MKVANALDEICAANMRRQHIEALLSQLATGKEQDVKDTEITQAAIKGRKRSALDCLVDTSKFDISRPVKKVKKHFAKALGIKRKL
jgi:hypothetical protein